MFCSPSNWQVVDGDLSEILALVDDEETTEGDSSLLVEYAIGAGEFSAFVGKQGNVHFAKSTLFAWGVAPGQVAEVGVGGGGQQFATDLLEFIGTVGERYDFRWADKSAVKWNFWWIKSNNFINLFFVNFIYNCVAYKSSG